MNPPSSAGSNDLIAMIGGLAWLQDTAADNVKRKWSANYRDVLILDSSNRPTGVLNLTSHDLSVSGNYATMKELLLATAKKADLDADGLWDDWEMLHFLDLSQGPLDDSDLDGVENIKELAFGTHPKDATSRPATLFGSQNKSGAAHFNVRFRRPAGGLFDYVMETSSDLKTWSRSIPSDWKANSGFRVFFDGSGVAEATFVSTLPMSAENRSFVKLRAVAR